MFANVAFFPNSLFSLLSQAYSLSLALPCLQDKNTKYTDSKLTEQYSWKKTQTKTPRLKPVCAQDLFKHSYPIGKIISAFWSMHSKKGSQRDLQAVKNHVLTKPDQ